MPSSINYVPTYRRHYLYVLRHVKGRLYLANAQLGKYATSSVLVAGRQRSQSYYGTCIRHQRLHPVGQQGLLGTSQVCAADFAWGPLA